MRVYPCTTLAVRPKRVGRISPGLLVRGSRTILRIQGGSSRGAEQPNPSDNTPRIAMDNECRAFGHVCCPADSVAKVTAEFATPFTRLVGCRAPIQLAVMGGGTGTPELAAAVSQAGGLGMLSSTFPMALEEQLSWVRERTEQPVGVGFFAFDLPTRTEELELAARRARVVDVFWGDPDAIVVERIHAGGAIAFWQVSSVDEAVAAVDAGCDAVIAPGIEAGGHVRGTTPLATLLQQVIAAVEVPVIAAGGIATGATLAEALNAAA